MQQLYFLALVGTRLISVLSMLILSHVMTTEAFGQFALINTNALAVQMVAGSWLVSIANRSMVSAQGNIDRTMMAAIMAAMLIITGAALATGVIYGALHPTLGWMALATAALATAFIAYEMALALKNAIGQAAAYATFAMYRNVLALVLGLAFVLGGSGPLGPVIGLLIATAIPLVSLPNARLIWTSARPSLAALRHIRPHLGHGLAGGIAFGIYIIVNAPGRNIFAQHFGTSVSGIWTLSADLFYGPLAVMGNAYGLSQVRLIYLSASAGDSAALQRRARALIEFTLVLGVPYAIGCCLFARDAVRLLFPQEQASIAAAIVVPAAVQGAALLLLYSLTSVALAWRRFWLVAVMVLTVAAAATGGALVGSGIVGGAHAAMAGSVGAVMFWLAWGVAVGLVHVRWGELAKLALASAVLWASAMATTMVLGYFGARTGVWIASAGVGSICFAASALWLRLSGFIDMLPPAMRGYIPYLTRQSDDN